MSPRAWVLNLDADQELAVGPGYAPSRAVEEPLRRHAASIAATLPAGDVWAHGDASGLLGACWCPTPRALTRLRALGAVVPAAPSVEVLRQVNGRSFAHALVALEGERRVLTTDAAQRVLQTGRWMVHREHTFAGRGHRFIDGPPGDADLAWIAKGLALGPLLIAPRLEPSLEVGLHGFIQGRSVRRGELTVQEVERGQWVRSMRAPGALRAAEQRALDATFDAVAAALIEADYFGPFGIDAFRHATGFHPLGELNARYSMGYPTGMGGW